MHVSGIEFAPERISEIAAEYDDLSGNIEVEEQRLAELILSPVGRVAETGRTTSAAFLNAETERPEAYKMWERLYEIQQANPTADSVNFKNDVEDVLKQSDRPKRLIAKALLSRIVHGRLIRETASSLVSLGEEELHKAPEELLTAVALSTKEVVDLFYQSAYKTLTVYFDKVAEAKDKSLGGFLFNYMWPLHPEKSLGGYLITFMHTLHTDPFAADFPELRDRLHQSAVISQSTHLMTSAVLMYKSIDLFYTHSPEVNQSCKDSIADQRQRAKRAHSLYQSVGGTLMQQLPAFHEASYVPGQKQNPWHPAEQWQSIDSEITVRIVGHIGERSDSRAVLKAISQSKELDAIEAYNDSDEYRQWEATMTDLGQPISGSTWLAKVNGRH